MKNATSFLRVGLMLGLLGWTALAYPREGVKTAEDRRLPEPGSNSGQEAEPQREPEPAKRAAEPLVLTEADRGRTIEATVGQAIVIRLKGNPTTGFLWAVGPIEGEALEHEGEVAYEGPARALPGAGGTFVARFQAVAAGEATVPMRYARPWEVNQEPAETFGVTVKVAGAAEVPAVRIVNQWRGSQGGRTPGRRVVTDPKSFQAAWKARGRGEPPEVDFTRHTVLLVDMGMRNTGGYAVTISSVERKDGKVVATVHSTAPGPGDMVTQALTSPWCMAEIDVAGKEVEFVEAGPRGAGRRRELPPPGRLWPPPGRLPVPRDR